MPKGKQILRTQNWIQQFVKECPTLVLKNEMFVVVAIEDLDEIDVFQENVYHCLIGFIESSIIHGVNLATFRRWNPSPHEVMFKSMFACLHSCPFCKALCDASHSNITNETHFTLCHRPMGIVGVREGETENLSTSICTEMVAGDGEFTTIESPEKWYRYKDYHEVNSYHKSWKITGDTSRKQSMYWKWFMATFSEELANQHGAALETPNFFWKFISFQWAKEQLITEYKL